MADEAFRTLDIKYAQVAIEREDDAEFRWHHYLLLARVEGSTWIGADPDLVLGPIDLSEEEHHVLRRNALFPAAVLAEEDGLVVHDPIADGELRRLYREARLQASLLGGAALEEAEGQDWLFSEFFEGRLGEKVGTDILEDPVGFTSLSGYGIALVDCSMYSPE